MSQLLQRSYATAATMRRVSMVRLNTQTAASRVRQHPSSCLASSSQVESTRSSSSVATPAAASFNNFTANHQSFPRRQPFLVTNAPLPQTSGRQFAHIRWFSSDDSDEKKEKKEKKEAKAVTKDDAKNEEVEEAKAELKKEDEPKKEDAASSGDAKPAGESKPETSGEGDDEVPNWQNPLHHNNPEKQKIFEEQFPPGEMPVQELPPFEDPNDPDKVLASKEIYDLSDEILNLSMLEMNELVNKLADHFGFEKPPFHGSDGSGGGDDGDGDDEDGAGDVAPAEEKTAFNLKLVSYDDKAKIKVIKEVRAIAGLGLKEAKEMVEGAPKVVMKDIGKDAAEEMKAKLEAVGAVIEIE